MKIDLGLDKDDSKTLENGEVLQSHTYCNSGEKVIYRINLNDHGYRWRPRCKQ
ncbi:hypothetical protein [Vibrio vulnificus]|uniref:hypothetical protein n=1 Tax=Vibrio vulnificus TaxID=672 RepID=UPI003B75BCE7